MLWALSFMKFIRYWFYASAMDNLNTGLETSARAQAKTGLAAWLAENRIRLLQLVNFLGLFKKGCEVMY